MKFISEDIINKVAENAELTTEQQIEYLKERQPILLAYLVSEQFDLLTDEEKDYFIYLAWVLHQAVSKEVGELEMIDEEEIGELEEANWEKLEKSGKGDFRERLNPFFKNTLQEDLLAFVEDGLIDDEEDFITEAGRELMFVGLKTLIDVLTIE